MNETRLGGAAPSSAVPGAIRAAVMLAVAAGINFAVVRFVPSYEPLFLFLVVIAVVTLLEGVFAGAIAAAVATALYALLFVAHAALLETSVGLPAVTGALTVVICGSIVEAWQRRRHRRLRRRGVSDEEAPPPAAEIRDALASRNEIVRLERRVADLQAQLQAATAERDELRAKQAGFDEELREMVARLTERHERELAEAVAERDAARAKLQGVPPH